MSMLGLTRNTRRVKAWLYKLWKVEEGMGTLEIILIVAVIVIIAVAFRKWIVQWVENLFNESNTEMQDTKLDKVTVPSP